MMFPGTSALSPVKIHCLRLGQWLDHTANEIRMLILNSKLSKHIWHMGKQSPREEEKFRHLIRWWQKKKVHGAKGKVIN